MSIFKNKLFILDIFFLSILILCSVKYSFKIETFFDLHLADETSYLTGGLKFLKERTLANAQYSPIYGIWYSFIHLIFNDPISVFYWNKKILCFLTTIILYILLRVVGIRAHIAILGSFYWLISSANLPNSPHVNQLAVVIFVLFWCIGYRCKSKLIGLAVIGLGISLSTFVRVEFYNAIPLLLLLIVYETILELKHGKKSKVYSVAIFSILLVILGNFVLCMIFGIPWVGSRSWESFGPHFSLHWASWTSSELNPWTHWKIFIKEAFPTANSISTALLENPLAFFRHMYENIFTFFIFLKITLHHKSCILPGRWVFIERIESWILLFFIIGVFIHQRKFISDKIKNISFYLKSPVHLSFLLPALVIISAAIVIFPQFKQNSFIVFFIILLVAKVFNNAFQTPKNHLILGLLVWLATPTLTSPWSTGQSAGQVVLDTIKFIKKLPINNNEKEIVVLEDGGGFSVYLGANYRSIWEYIKDAPFFDFIKREKVKIIICGNAMKKDVRFKDDKGFIEFLNNSEIFGFKHYKDIPNVDIFIHYSLFAAQ